MIENKTDQTEEEYCFLQEAVKKQHRIRAACVIKKVVLACFLAVLFGITAGVAFWYTQNRLEKHDTRVYRESMMAHAGNETDNTSQKSKTNGDQERISAYEDYWKTIKDVGMRCNRAVVAIRQRHTESWYKRSQKDEQVQSGIVFEEKGDSLYILTQTAALLSGKNLEVEFADGSVAQAKLKAKNDNLDMAVLTVNSNDISNGTMKKIVIMDFTQYASEIGLGLNERVMVFGCPNGIMKSVMPGNVVNADLTASVLDGSLNIYATDIVYTEGGNGFVTNIEGRMVGMLTDAFKDTTGSNNWAFISAADIVAEVQRMVEGKSSAVFGIYGKDIGEDKGINVTEVLVDSAAYHGGIRVADVLCSIDGCEIKNMSELHFLLSTHESGDKIQVRSKRKSGGKEKVRSLKITLQ